MHTPQPRSNRQLRVNQALQMIVSDFLNQNSNRLSLITVTRCDVAPNLSAAVAYISVIPDDKEAQAIEFLKRRQYDLHQFVKEKSALRRAPRVKFEIDKGEKNRQLIDNLSRTIEEE